MNIVFNLIKKDIKALFLNFYATIYSLLMGILLIFLLSLGLQKTERLSAEIASVIFWIASFFGLILLFKDIYKTDTLRIREELKLSGVEPQVVWFSKSLVVFVFFLLIQAVFLITTILFLDLSPKGNILKFFVFLILIDVGLISLSSLFGAITQEICTESLMTLILFPLEIPLLLGGIKTNIVFFNGIGNIGSWIKLILCCDAIFIGISLIIFPFLYNP